VSELRVELEGLHSRAARHSDASTEAQLAKEREASARAALQAPSLPRAPRPAPRAPRPAPHAPRRPG
jgi:hypothetical protein